MSHMRAEAREIVLASVIEAFGKREERSHAWPNGATKWAEEQMKGLSPCERQILLWELGQLEDEIRIGGASVQTR